jgi:hypothetical protein
MDDKLFILYLNVFRVAILLKSKLGFDKLKKVIEYYQSK